MCQIINCTISILSLIAILGCTLAKVTSGTQNKPLASHEEARDRARELPANTPVNITVEEGGGILPGTVHLLQV